ncbi:glutamate receptor U1-like isoform X2 [Rhopilema esculentum]
MFHMSGSGKSSLFMASLLNLQAFDIWRRSCVAEGNLASVIPEGRRAVMISSIEENSLVIQKLMKKLMWPTVGIIYQNSREADVEILTGILRNDDMTVAIAGIGCRSNGSIESFAHRTLRNLISEKPFGIIIIFDEDKLQKLFDYLRTDISGLKSMALSFIIFDPVVTNTLTADPWYTLIVLQISLEETAKLQELRTEIDKTAANSREIAKHALLYDAVMTAGTVIDTLASMGNWTGYSGSALNQSQLRAANGLEFNKELKKFKGTGLTGKIEFDEHGFRKKMPFHVMNLKNNVFEKIGSISEIGSVLLERQPVSNVDFDQQLKVNGHLKIVTILNEPYTMKRTFQNGTVEYYGLLIDIANALAKEANFTYSLYEVADGRYGHIDNGRWTGLIGDVLYKKADMALAALTITASREEVIHFNTPYMEVSIGLIKKKTNVAHLDLLLFMEPFTGVVWLLTLTACLFVGLFLFFVDAFSPFGWKQVGERATGRPGTEFNILNSIWFSMASILLQGPDNTPRSLSGRILVGCFWFYVLILTSSYTANLAAFFTSTKQTEQQVNLESLLKEGAQFTTIEHYALEQFLKTSNYKIYNRVHERMTIQKALASGLADALSKLEKDPSMYYLEEKPFIQWTINKKPCDLKIIDTTLPKTYFGIPVRKDSSTKPAISHAILKLLESGFLAERRFYYMDTLSECKETDDHQHGSM